MNDMLVEAPMAGFLSSSDTTLFNKVDEVLERSITVGDPLIAFEFAQSLQRDGLLKGLAIAKLMYKVKQSWALFEVAGVGDTFENLVQSMNGYSPATVDKYIRMWESIFENPDLPEDIKNSLSGRPIRDLMLLTAASREGSLTDEDWGKVSVAGDTSEVRDIVRKARGEVTSSKNAVTIILQIRDNGTYPRGALTASKDGLRIMIGTLDVDNEDEIAKKAITRLVNAARILEA